MSSRNHEIVIKVDREELEKLRVKAHRLGLPLATFVRAIALHAELVQDSD